MGERPAVNAPEAEWQLYNAVIRWQVRAEQADLERDALGEALRRIRYEDRHNLPARLKVIHAIADEALATLEQETSK